MMYKYEHGGDIYSQETTADGKRFVDFSANINPHCPAKTLSFCFDNRIASVYLNVQHFILLSFAYKSVVHE